ncbi:MAG: MATE family efflux transporter [bacterium]|nr:MATE family efflux transporter [bacterium]
MTNTPIRLSDHFSCWRLLRFTFPSIVMMVFTSIYGVIDGFFVSNFAGKQALAAITLIFPLLGMLGAIGFMLGTGGAALVGKLLGEGRREAANRRFSLFVVTALAGGLLLMVLGQLFLEPTARFLGAEGEMLDSSLLYGRIALCTLPFFMLQYMFQTFFITAEKPKLGLAVTVAAGSLNILLDGLFVAVLHWGLLGAALATAASELLGGGLPLLYFARKNSGLLMLTRPEFSFCVLLKACGNGASEFLGNIAFSLQLALFNYQLLRLAGENGVAAFGVLLYASYFFAMIFAGYDIGVAPLFSYNFGAANRGELRNLFFKSLFLNTVAGLGIALFCFFAAEPFARLFTGYDPGLLVMTTRALRLFAPVFTVFWINVFASSLFTALNNGTVSALITVFRIMVCACSAVLILPWLFGLDGVWCAWPVAELAAMVLTLVFLVRLRTHYGYA